MRVSSSSIMEIVNLTVCANFNASFNCTFETLHVNCSRIRVHSEFYRWLMNENSPKIDNNLQISANKKIYRIYIYISRINLRLKILSRNRNTLFLSTKRRKKKRGLLQDRKKINKYRVQGAEKSIMATIRGPVPSVHVFHRWWQAWNLGRVAIPMVITGQERIINTASRVISANLSAKPGLETPLSFVQNLIFA